MARFGWAALGRRIDNRCFKHEPSIASSLKLLRRTPWVRTQVEALYLDMLRTAPDRKTFRTRPNT
ncbi:DNA-binding protein VF530 [Aromatoleum evansii]|nr:DNA-binding protein VF530 [Aromatoleum evansii]